LSERISQASKPQLTLAASAPASEKAGEAEPADKKRVAEFMKALGEQANDGAADDQAEPTTPDRASNDAGSAGGEVKPAPKSRLLDRIGAGRKV
jgi:hypothetical protein